MADKTNQDLVVFMVRKEAICAERGRELWRGELLYSEKGKLLCLACADLDHLEYLPRGDTALTRRASKYSKLRAVVVKWSPARKRHERQGILAEPGAIERAEQETLVRPRCSRPLSRLPARERTPDRRSRLTQIQRPGGPIRRRQGIRCRRHSPGRHRTYPAHPYPVRRTALQSGRPPKRPRRSARSRGGYSRTLAEAGDENDGD